MIFTERTIMVVNDSATINKPLILYRGDKNIELKITIAESQFKFRNTDASNVIETTDASYAQLVINTPYNSPIFSDVAATKNGAVIFVITETMIDEIREVGAYEIQIRLLDDNKQSRASIPPVSNAIEIREPIAIEDGSAVDSNAVNVAKVNRALTTTSAPLEAFDSQGNYIKNNWGDGDPITDAALNKMEAGIEGVNNKVINILTGESITPVTYEWIVGGVTSEGVLRDATNRIRVVDYITFSEKTTFQSNNPNYVLRWYKYDTNKTFITELGSWTTRAEFEASSDYVYRVAIRKIDDSDISTDVVSYFEIYTGTKETDNKNNIKAFYNDYPALFYPHKFKLEAHRGYSDKYPENTLLAFEEAGKRSEYSGIETDVHRTSDGVFILMHDSTIDRTTNGTGKPSAYTYEQLQEFYIDGGNGWDAQYANQFKIPKLTEYLKICNKYGKIPYIQVDQIESSYLGELIELLDKEGWKGRCVLTSFTLSDLFAVRDITDEYVFEYMIPISTEDSSYTAALNTLSSYKNVIFRPDAASFLGKSNAQDFIYKFREAGILLECYGLPVGDTSTLNKMLEFGIEGATCNSYVGFSDILGVTNTASDITIADVDGHFTSTNVEGALAELFQFVSNGKTLIASAITDMGIDASNTDSFEAMANKIRTIIAQQPLYTFGLLSDVHVDGDGTDEAHSISDLTNALSFLENAGADFIAYTGDMTYNGRDEDYTSLKTCLETSTVPNYCVRGNHDAYSLADGYASATGCKEDYIITQNNDLLIFISCADTNHDTGGLTTSKLDWLENLLQTNTSTRVFLFYHYFVDGTSGNGTGVYPYGTLNPSNAIALRFINMVKQYSNLIYCNGHSHMRFNIQDQDANANYYHNDGECYYIHIPSTAKPRFPSGDTVADYYEGSEGYLVEVYANKVIFKPIDFIASEYLTKYNYTANVAQGTNEPTLPPEPTIIDIAWNDGVKIDRSTGAETSSSEYSASDFIACDNSKTYTLNLASDFPTHGGNVFACYYDENKSFISCGSDFIGSYQSSSDVYTADLSLPTNAKYIKLRLFAAVDASTMDKSIITLTTPAITTHTITYEWQVGGLKASGELNDTATNRLRTTEYKTITGATTFTGSNGYQVWWYRFNASDHSFVDSAGAWAESYTLEPNDSYVYYIAIRKSDNSTIGVDEASNVTIAVNA